MREQKRYPVCPNYAVKGVFYSAVAHRRQPFTGYCGGGRGGLWGGRGGGGLAVTRRFVDIPHDVTPSLCARMWLDTLRGV